MQSHINKFLDHSVNTYLLIDEQYIIQYANQGCLTITGYKADELVGQHMEILIPEPYRARHPQMVNDFILNRATETHNRSERLINLLTKDQNEIYVFVNINKFDKDDATISVTLEDASLIGAPSPTAEGSREHAKDYVKQLQRHKIRFGLAQKLANVGCWDWNVKTGELYLSPQVYRIFRVDPAVIDASFPSFIEHIHPEDKVLVMRAIQKAMDDPQYTYDIIHRIIRGDGTVASVREIGAFERDENGEARLMIGSVQDVTEVETTRRTMQHALEESVEANSLKTRFMANMSHEFRTPLNAIIGFCEMLKMELLAPLGHPRYKEYVGDIGLSAEHLLSLVNSVLDMSRLEVGNIKLEEEDISIDHLLDSIMSLVYVAAQAQSIDVSTDVQPGVQWVKADFLRLKQILLNLTINAIKYNKPNGSVTIGVYGNAAGEIIFEIKDTGIGMAEEDIPQALNSFARLEHERENCSHGDEGVGLGLAIANSLSELHGAIMSIDSQLGTGTTVQIRMPSWRTHQVVSPVRAV